MSNTRSRKSSSNTEATNANIDAHRADNAGDHGRRKPMRDRIPLSSGRNLGGIDEYITPGFVPYWCAEQNINRFMQAGYEHVTDKEGNNIKRPSGASYLILLQQPEEWHKEDQEALKRRTVDGLAESARIKGNEYTSNSNEHSIQRDTTVTDEDILG